MSLFRKPKKHIQRRVFGSNEDEEFDKSENEIEAKAKTKETKDRPKQTLLSFDVDDDDGEVFKIKKSSHTKRMLSEKRKAKAKKSIVTEPDVEPIDIVIKQTNTLKMEPTNTPKMEPINTPPRQRSPIQTFSDSDENDGHDPHIHKFSQPTESLRSIVERGQIPDAAMIHAARKRRQRAREGFAGEFIPVESADEPRKIDNTNERGNRFIRETEDDDSDEERVNMTVNTQKLDMERRQKQFEEAQDDSEAEVDEWENQQIKKAMPMATYENIKTFSPSERVDLTQDMNVGDLESGPKSPEMILEKLRERVKALRESKALHMNNLLEIEGDLEDTEKEIFTLTDKGPECAEKYKFYQEFRGFITDLVECFDEKISPIVDCEQRMLDVMEKRASFLAERRRQDVRDQVEEVTEQAKSTQNRSPNEQRVRRAAEREGRRNRRRRAREQLDQTHMIITGGNLKRDKHLDGMSSDDELPDQDVMNYHQQTEQLVQAANELLADVIDDYSSYESILHRFEAWRNVDYDSYKEAYVNMILPKVISPLIRLEMLLWDPFVDVKVKKDESSGCVSVNLELEQYRWLKCVMTYNLDENETEVSLQDDPDVHFLPIIIDKIIIPKLTQFIVKIWDPMSSGQSLRIVTLVTRLIRKYPSLESDSAALKSLFQAIIDKLNHAVEHDVFIPIFPKTILDSKAPFFQRQFHAAVKLLGNITCWQGTLADHVLKKLVITSVLNRYLLSGLRLCQPVDAVSKIQLVLNALPRTWVQSKSCKDDLTLFVACLDHITCQLNGKNPLHADSFDILTSIRASLHL